MSPTEIALHVDRVAMVRQMDTERVKFKNSNVKNIKREKKKDKRRLKGRWRGDGSTQ